MLRGAFAASITPLREHGTRVDDDAFGPLVDFFVREGLDGILALGTAGEGILLRVEERRHVADLFLQASDKRLQVAVHCGAQTTADTVTLAVHAAEVGADAVVVIGPPYFKLDEKAQYGHFLAAATACAPVPFYVYEFAATTGYAIAPAVLERLRDDAPNVVGLKVSDTPFDAFEKYLLPGFDIFVGPEALIADGMARGARGAVSALASALPREVAAVVRDPTPEGAARLGELRTFVERFPRQAALKRLLALQGVPVNEDVRAPLRPLTVEERDELDAWAADAAGLRGIELLVDVGLAADEILRPADRFGEILAEGERRRSAPRPRSRSSGSAARAPGGTPGARRSSSSTRRRSRSGGGSARPCQPTVPQTAYPVIVQLAAVFRRSRRSRRYRRRSARSGRSTGLPRQP